MHFPEKCVPAFLAFLQGNAGKAQERLARPSDDVMDAHYGPSTMPLKARAALKSFHINQQEDMQSQISQLYVLFEEAGMPETERLLTLISALEDHPPARQLLDMHGVRSAYSHMQTLFIDAMIDV
jgi:hypothetical protein